MFEGICTRQKTNAKLGGSLTLTFLKEYLNVHLFISAFYFYLFCAKTVLVL